MNPILNYGITYLITASKKFCKIFRQNSIKALIFFFLTKLLYNLRISFETGGGNFNWTIFYKLN